MLQSETECVSGERGYQTCSTCGWEIEGGMSRNLNVVAPVRILESFRVSFSPRDLGFAMLSATRVSWTSITICSTFTYI